MNKFVKIKREDLEELKRCFEFLRKENEELKEEIAAEPEDIGIDLTNLREALGFEKESQEEDEMDEPELIEEKEPTSSTDLDDLINPIN